MNEIDTRVLAGLDWLDANAPADWPRLIDTSALALSDPNCCVLGQVFAEESSEGYTGYNYAIDRLGLKLSEVGDLGFIPATNLYTGELITDDWLRVIAERQAALA